MRARLAAGFESQHADRFVVFLSLVGVLLLLTNFQASKMEEECIINLVKPVHRGNSHPKPELTQPTAECGPMMATARARQNRCGFGVALILGVFVAEMFLRIVVCGIADFFGDSHACIDFTVVLSLLLLWTLVEPNSSRENASGRWMAELIILSSRFWRAVNIFGIRVERDTLNQDLFRFEFGGLKEQTDLAVGGTMRGSTDP